jgi:hypothetical protein
MRNTILLLTLAIFATTKAQVGPSPTPSVIATNYDVQSMRVPAQSSSTQVPLNLNPPASGGDVLDVITSNPSVVVSLLLPNGTQVTPANGASLGYSFDSIAPGSLDTVNIPSP